MTKKIIVARSTLSPDVLQAFESNNQNVSPIGTPGKNLHSSNPSVELYPNIQAVLYIAAENKGLQMLCLITIKTMTCFVQRMESITKFSSL